MGGGIGRRLKYASKVNPRSGFLSRGLETPQGKTCMQVRILPHSQGLKWHTWK